jgi:hypothetical protein
MSAMAANETGVIGNVTNHSNFYLESLHVYDYNIVPGESIKINYSVVAGNVLGEGRHLLFANATGDVKSNNLTMEVFLKNKSAIPVNLTYGHPFYLNNASNTIEYNITPGDSLVITWNVSARDFLGNWSLFTNTTSDVNSNVQNMEIVESIDPVINDIEIYPSLIYANGSVYGEVNFTDVDGGFINISFIWYNLNTSIVYAQGNFSVVAVAGVKTNVTFGNVTNITKSRGEFVALNVTVTDLLLGSDEAQDTLVVTNFQHNISFLDNVTIIDGGNLYYQVNCTDNMDSEVFNFTDNSSIVNITNDGVINHTYSNASLFYGPINVSCNDQDVLNASTVFFLSLFQSFVNGSVCAPMTEVYFVPNITKFNVSTLTLTDLNVTAENQTVCTYNVTNTLSVSGNLSVAVNASLLPSYTTCWANYTNQIVLSTSYQNLSGVNLGVNDTMSVNCTFSYDNASSGSEFEYLFRVT